MQDLAIALRDVVVATDAYRQTVARVLGLGVSEAATIGELLHEGPQRPTALARRAGITSASMTGQLDRLELAGLVVRQNDPGDRRSVLVVLTDNGRSVITALFALFAEDVTAGVVGAHPDHIAELTRVLGVVASALHARAGAPEALRDALTSRMSEPPG